MPRNSREMSNQMERENMSDLSIIHYFLDLRSGHHYSKPNGALLVRPCNFMVTAYKSCFNDLIFRIHILNLKTLTPYCRHLKYFPSCLWRNVFARSSFLKFSINRASLVDHLAISSLYL
ncbi:hypothetical protein AAZX31_13G207200 [Glycine max]